MKRRVLRIASRVATKLEKDLERVTNTSLPVIFLGGRCLDNIWREQIKKEFGNKFFFLDPFDENWSSKNVYDELAGLIKSDYAVFYRGGESSEDEKNFLDNTQMTSYEEFGNLDDLRNFLKKRIERSSRRLCRTLRCAQLERTIAVDFDGPIHRFSKGYSDGTIYDSPTEGSFNALSKLMDRGFRIVIFTARKPFEEVRNWLMKKTDDSRIQQLEITDKKVPAIAYVDDRGLRFTNWQDMLNYFV